MKIGKIVFMVIHRDVEECEIERETLSSFWFKDDGRRYIKEGTEEYSIFETRDAATAFLVSQAEELMIQAKNIYDFRVACWNDVKAI